MRRLSKRDVVKLAAEIARQCSEMYGSVSEGHIAASIVLDMEIKNDHGRNNDSWEQASSWETATMDALIGWHNHVIPSIHIDVPRIVKGAIEEL